jgi:hypothetical protein
VLLWFETILINECISYYMWCACCENYLKNAIQISLVAIELYRCDRIIGNHWFWSQYALLQRTSCIALPYHLLPPIIVCCMWPPLPPKQIRCNLRILPRRLVCCITIWSIATKNCLLHVTSITTNTNSLQPTYITSKSSSLHYHMIYCHHIWYVAISL